MASGGARNRSGPPADPMSRNSARRGYTLTALPSEGFDGDRPEFPLMRFEIRRPETSEDGRRSMVVDDDASQEFACRELELWQWAWSTPQACAWSMQPWRWHTVAMWVRTAVVCESSEATAADKGSIHRFADQIGLTPAGLRENGWGITVDEVGAKAAEHEEAAEEAPRRERRLRAVGAE